MKLYSFDPSKHFNVVSKLLLGWYDVATSDNVRQRWNNLVYVNVIIYNVEKNRITVVYFDVDLNNVRQRRNSVVIFNVKFCNVGQCWNNVVNKITCKMKKKWYFWISNKSHLNWILLSQHFVYFISHFKGYM